MEEADTSGEANSQSLNDNSPPLKLLKKCRRKNDPIPLDDIEIEILNGIITDLNSLYEEIVKVDNGFPKVSKSLFRRVVSQFIGKSCYFDIQIVEEDIYEDFNFPELTDENVARLRLAFFEGQRLAYFAKRRKVKDKDMHSVLERIRMM